MEIKTCEQYVMNELDCARNEIDRLKDNIEYLNQIIDAYKSRKFRIADVEDELYDVSFRGYKLDNIVNYNNLTVDYLKEVLADESNEKLMAFCELKSSAERWYSDNLGEVRSHEYDCLMYVPHRKEETIAAINVNTLSIWEIDDESYFLNEEKAKEHLCTKAREAIQSYINKHSGE